MNVIVDIGNSRVKIVVMCSGVPQREYVAGQVDKSLIDRVVSECGCVSRAIVSSTRGDEDAVCELLRRHVDFVMAFKPATTPIPLGNDYATPATLGADRLAAAVGASALYPDCDLLIVDFGTAITIDYVVDGCFKGGNISPGMTTRFRALHDYTRKLPLCSATESVLDYGRTTCEAIEQGVMQGITGEIERYISLFLQKNEKKCIIFTGGDAKYFVKRIKNAIFADCEPVIYGLNRILDYNAEI